MNIPPIFSVVRIHWTTIAASIGWLLVGVLTVINSVELSRLSEQNPGDTLNAQVQVLATHVADLAEQLELFPKRPDAVLLKRYDAERQTLEQRLAAIEQALNERQVINDLQPLRDRLDQLEQGLIQYSTQTTARPNPNPSPSPSPSPSPNPPVKVRVAEPSFQVIGVELRAHERFLAILPGGANSLFQVRLLRVGNKEEGWRLETIEAKVATFSQSGKKHRIGFAAERKYP